MQNAGKDLKKIKPEKETKPADVRLCVCASSMHRKKSVPKRLILQSLHLIANSRF